MNIPRMRTLQTLGLFSLTKHGKAWVDHVVTPLAADAAWAEAIVRGARWRWLVNDAFFRAMAERLVPGLEQRRAS